MDNADQDYIGYEARMRKNLQAYGLNANNSVNLMRSLGLDVVRAYNATRFEFAHGSGTIVLVPGRVNAALDNMLAIKNQKHWCFITACNPYSEVLKAQENARRHRVLGDILRLNYLDTREGIGRSPSDDWREPSYFVPGIDFLRAEALGIVFDQNAILIGEAGGSAELLFLSRADTFRRRDAGGTSLA